MRRTEIAAKAKTGKNGLSKAKKAAAALCGAAYLAVGAMPMTVFAAGGGTGAITQPLDNLKTLVVAIIGAVGVIILAKNVMDVCNPYMRMGLPTSSRIPPP